MRVFSKNSDRIVTVGLAFLALAQIVLLIACGSSNAKKTTLTSITVSPSSASISAGSTQQFTAMGIYSDNSTQDLTSTATWSSSATSVATVSGGLASGVAAGTATITATSGSVSGTASLTVTPTLKSIAVMPSTASIGIGSTQQFTAMATYSDSTTKDITASASWSSSSTSIATINASGTATGVTAGTATITATSGSVSGTASLTVTAPLVSIAVTPGSASIVLGSTQQFMATGTYADNSTKNLTSSVTWTSSVTTVATISGGLATSAGVGSTTITASAGSIMGTATLTVTGTSSSSGSTGILVVPFNGTNVDAAYQPYSSNESVQVVNLDSQSSNSALITSIKMPSGYRPNATAANQVTMKVVAVSYNSSDVQVIDANTNTVVNTFKSPATDYASFSGGSCIICGAFFNPANNLVVLDTGDGYYTLDVNTGTFTALVMAFPSENFSFDSANQLIISPTYDQDPNYGAEVQILDVTANTVSTNTSLGIELPDSAATDIITNVSVVVEEDGGNQTLINLNELTVANGVWTAPTTVFVLPGCVDDEMTMIATDSATHTLFSSEEFYNCTAIETLASSAPTGAPPMPTGYVWDTMPDTPDKASWINGGDPHGVAIFTSVVDGKHYGFLVNEQQNWIARIDLAGAQGAPQMGQGQIDLTPYTFYLPTTK